MIYNISGDFYKKESYKERNLYYKFFAGYFFNELIKGHENRKNSFIELLKSKAEDGDRFFGNKDEALIMLNQFDPPKIEVTFDYHSVQETKDTSNTDHGEMSDVLLWGGSGFISIECKFLEKMNIVNDVIKVQKRMSIVKEHFNVQNILQVLLMKNEKWKNSIKRGIKKQSFSTYLHKSHLSFPVIVLFWEDLETITTDKAVGGYLLTQLKRRK